MSDLTDAPTATTTATQVANIIRQLRAMAPSYAGGTGVQYTGFAIGRDLAPPQGAEECRAYLLLALEIAALSHAGLDPVNDLDSMLAVSLLRAVVDQI